MPVVDPVAPKKRDVLINKAEAASKSLNKLKKERRSLRKKIVALTEIMEMGGDVSISSYRLVQDSMAAIDDRINTLSRNVVSANRELHELKVNAREEKSGRDKK